MKATVVAIKKGKAVIMTADGTILMIRNKNLMIGDVLNMKEAKQTTRYRLGYLLATAALFIVLLSGGVYAYYTPAYNVSLDVNPGIVMEVNMFERVIKAEGVNDEAEQVLARVKVMNMKIEDALNAAIEQMSEQGYLPVDIENQIMVATSTRNQKDNDQLVVRIRTSIQNRIDEKGIHAEVAVVGIGYDMVIAAKAIDGMTPGKYNLIVNLLNVDPEDVEDYINVSVREIMSQYTEGKGNPNSNEQENQNGSEQGNQNGDDQGQNQNQNEAGDIDREQGQTRPNDEPSGNKPTDPGKKN